MAVAGDTVVVRAYGESGPAGGDGSDNTASAAGAAYVFVRDVIFADGFEMAD